MSKKMKRAADRVKQLLEELTVASEPADAAPEKSYAEEIRAAAQHIFDHPDMMEGEIDDRWQDISKRHKKRIGSVRLDGQHAYDALAKAADDARVIEDANTEGRVSVNCADGIRITDKWGHALATYERNEDVPRALSDFEWPISSEDHRAYALAALDAQWAVVNLSGKTRYANLIGIKDGRGIEFSSKTDFVDKYANRLVEYTDAEGKEKDYPLTTAWLKHAARREYESVTFCPNCESERSDELNLFVGYGVEPKEGDWSLLRTHIRENVCRGDDFLFRWFMSWMAQLIQVPSEKTGVAVVLRGKKGTGKSKVGYWLRHIIGKAHAHQVSQRRHVTGNFNSHMAACILLVCEEAFWAGDKDAEGVIKALITEDTVMLEKKGVDAVPIPNFTRLLQTSNADWAVPASEDERRFFVLDVGESQMQNAAYFAAIDEQMKAGGAEAMLFDLMEYTWLQDDIDLRNPPKTEGLKKQVVKGLEPIPSWWRDALIEGGFMVDDDFIALPVNGGLVAKRTVTASLKPVLKGSWSPNQLTTHITEDLKSLVPDLGHDGKMSEHGDHGGKRVPAYSFPPLDALRAAWEKKFGEAPWEVTAHSPSLRICALCSCLSEYRSMSQNDSLRILTLIFSI